MWASALKLKNVGGERATDRAHARVPPGLRRREREQVRMFGRMIMLPASGRWPKEPKSGTKHIFKVYDGTDPRRWALLNHPVALDGQLLTFGREEGRQDMPVIYLENMICSRFGVYSKAPPRFGP